MNSLLSKFPEIHIKEFLARLKSGTIIRFFSQKTKPPKYKFFIVLEIQNENNTICGVYINSEINNFMTKNPHILNLQIAIKKEECVSLTKDISYIDCAQIKEIKYQDIYENITIFEIISENLKRTIVSTIEQSTFISNKNKEKFRNLI